MRDVLEAWGVYGNYRSASAAARRCCQASSRCCLSTERMGNGAEGAASACPGHWQATDYLTGRPRYASSASKLEVAAGAGVPPPLPRLHGLFPPRGHVCAMRVRCCLELGLRGTVDKQTLLCNDIV